MKRKTDNGTAGSAKTAAKKARREPMKRARREPKHFSENEFAHIVDALKAGKTACRIGAFHIYEFTDYKWEQLVKKDGTVLITRVVPDNEAGNKLLLKFITSFLEINYSKLQLKTRSRAQMERVLKTELGKHFYVCLKIRVDKLLGKAIESAMKEPAAPKVSNLAVGGGMSTVTTSPCITYLRLLSSLDSLSFNTGCSGNCFAGAVCGFSEGSRRRLCAVQIQKQEEDIE